MLTISTILSSIFWAGFFALLLKLLKKINFINVIGVHVWTFLVGLSFTTIIPFSLLHTLKNDYLYAKTDNSVGAFLFMMFIWISSAMINLLNIYLKHISARNLLFVYSSSSTKQIDKIANEIISKTDRKYVKISLSKLPSMLSPLLYGFKNSVIVLPKMEYTDQELRFILAHEYAHYKNMDNLIMLVARVYCAIFWWNPVGLVLLSELSQALEIKCDFCVVGEMNMADRTKYVDLLRKFAKVKYPQK